MSSRPAAFRHSSSTASLSASVAPLRTATRASRTERAGTAAGARTAAQARRDEPRADCSQRGQEPVERCSGGETVVVGQGRGQDAERRRMTALVLADPTEGLPLVRIRGDLEEPAVSELGSGLEPDVELAVATEGLVPAAPAAAPPEPCPSGSPRSPAAWLPRSAAARFGVEVVLGRGCPTRDGALRAASVHGHRRVQPAPLEEQTSQILLVKLLVLPDPDEGLADQRARLRDPIWSASTRAATASSR